MRRPGRVRALEILIVRFQLRERKECPAPHWAQAGSEAAEYSVRRRAWIQVESPAGLPGEKTYIVSLLDTMFVVVLCSGKSC